MGGGDGDAFGSPGGEEEGAFVPRDAFGRRSGLRLFAMSGVWLDRAVSPPSPAGSFGYSQDDITCAQDGTPGQTVDLVEDEEAGAAFEAEVAEGLIDGFRLLAGIGMRNVDDVEEERGFFELFEGSAEGSDELGGELLDESDGVGEEGGGARGETDAAGGRVEGGKELVLDQDVGPGEGAHEGGLAGVGVADERDNGNALARALTPVQRALAAHLLDLALEAGDAVADQAAVGLELGLAGAAGADAGAEPFEVRPLTTQAGKDVLVLGELDLQEALTGAGVLGENVEDEGGTVNDFDVEGVLQVALLGGGQFVIEDDRGVRGFGLLGDDLLELALADVGGGVVAVEALDGLADNVSARGAGEEAELFEGGFSAPAAAISRWRLLEVGSDEEGTLGFGGCSVERASADGVWPPRRL